MEKLINDMRTLRESLDQPPYLIEYRQSSRKTNVLLVLVVFLTASALFAKEPTNIFELGLADLTKITVTAPSKRPETIAEAPSIVTVVTAQEIELFGALDLQEVLERIVGVQTFNTRETGRNFVGIRSDHPKPADNSHVLMLLNGTPYNLDSYNGGFWLQAVTTSLPVQMIDRIEVIRGPGSVLHGAKAFQGVINIITKQATKNEASVTVGRGSWDSDIAKAFFTIKEGALKFSLGLSYLNTSGWDLENGNLSADVHEQNKGVLATLNYRNFYAAVWWATSKQFLARGNINTALLEGFVENDHHFIDLGYEHNLTEDWQLKGKLSTGGHRTGFSIVGKNGDIVDFVADDSLFELNAKGPIGENGNLLIGGVVNYLTGDYLTPRANISPPVPKWHYTTASLYAQFDYRITEWMKLTAGGQYNKVEDIPSVFVPRLGAIVNFNPEWGMKLLYGQAFRAPTTAEQSIFVSIPGVFTIVGSESLDFELVTTYDLQLFYNTDKTQTTFTIFQNEQEDLIVRRIDATGRVTFVNEDELTIRGIEFESKYFLTSRWSLSAGLTHQANEGANGVDDFTLMPAVEAKLGISYNGNKFTFGFYDSFRTNYKDITNRRTDTADVNPRSHDYHDISVNLSLKLDKILNWNDDRKLALDFHVTNLLNDTIYIPDANSTIGVNTTPADGGSFYSVSLKCTF